MGTEVNVADSVTKTDSFNIAVRTSFALFSVEAIVK
nr:MAG TPA: hypothetical protein [Caudoviricetes sp.]